MPILKQGEFCREFVGLCCLITTVLKKKDRSLRLQESDNKEAWSARSFSPVWRVLEEEDDLLSSSFGC